MAPDEEQMQAILNAKAMDEAMDDFGDEGDGDSDDERDTMTPVAPRETTIQALAESEIFGHTTEQMIYADEEGDQVDEAELRQIKALNELSGPDPEEVGDPATEEDLRASLISSVSTDERRASASSASCPFAPSIVWCPRKRAILWHR